MKTEMVFNHNADTVTEALGVTEGFDKRISALVEKVVEGEIGKNSEIAELMHNELKYEEILLLASEEFMSNMKQAMLLSLREQLEKALAGGSPEGEE